MDRALRLKVCGMRDPGNIMEVASLDPDYLGFIFYPGSSRYMGNDLDHQSLTRLNPSLQRVGVFVNATTRQIIEALETYQCSLAQLHGQESVEQCSEIKAMGFKVIKAFGISPGFDFSRLVPFAGSVDFFLFDTLTTTYGGSGKSFNWEILDDYAMDIPFFLSGRATMTA